MKGSFKEIFKPIIVLTIICLVVTALLAYINTITAPIIEAAEKESAQKAMTEVLPNADTFNSVELDTPPERVREIYSASNGAGYVFMLVTKGYGGDMKLICGVNSDGTISACKTLSHSETSGLGSKTAEDPYKNQYIGKNADSLTDVNAITGATISSNAYKNAIEDALKAFEMVKGAK